MHEGAIDRTDELLLAELAAVHEALDPMPSGLTDDVRFAITVQQLHAEVAELVATPMLAARADDTTTTADTITFTSGTISVMIAADRTGPDGLTLDGWVTAAGAEVELHVGDEVRRATADEHGRFVFTDVPRGRTWLVVHRPGGDAASPIVTPPVEL